MRKSCVPNIFTFINLSFGILSIIETHNGNYRLASIFIIAAALVDRYDGRIARFLQVSSDLGKELDSLADLVSFGVAPSILVFLLFDLNSYGPFGIIGIIILYFSQYVVHTDWLDIMLFPLMEYLQAFQLLL